MIRASQRKSSPTIARPLFICLYVIFPAIFAIAQTNAPELTTISAGSQVDRESKGGETQLFAVQVSSGQFLHLRVDQNGSDVVVNLLNPRGESLFLLDGP